jgi:hypothetical protein
LILFSYFILHRYKSILNSFSELFVAAEARQDLQQKSAGIMPGALLAAIVFGGVISALDRKPLV